MGQTTLSKTVVLNHPNGLHLRPAGVFCECAKRFDAKIEIVADSLRVDGKSILDLITLGAVHGTTLQIEATGTDAEAALEALADMIEKDLADLEQNETAAEQQG